MRHSFLSPYLRIAAAGALILALACAATLGAQQVPDSAFRPPVPRPAYGAGSGPRLCLDEGHNNFHTLDNRFWAFGELARRDGFRVSPLRASFSARALAACDLLVVSNAQWKAGEWDTYPYPTPSAFGAGEIEAVKAWVERGGRFLLIADHMPLAGSAAKLAAEFGAKFWDGFAYEKAAEGSVEAQRGGGSAAPTLFKPDDGTLPAHSIRNGRDAVEQLTQVRSFTGQAFQWEVAGVKPVLVLPKNYILLEPRIAWQFDSTTKQRPVGGWLQGATLRLGSGRVAMFGEAAMFSAQVAGANRTPMGMNAPMAEQNPQFVLNTLHWLTGLVDP